MLRQASLLVGVLVMDILTSVSDRTFWDDIYDVDRITSSGGRRKGNLHSNSAAVAADMSPHASRHREKR